MIFCSSRRSAGIRSGERTSIGVRLLALFVACFFLTSFILSSFILAPSSALAQAPLDGKLPLSSDETPAKVPDKPNTPPTVRRATSTPSSGAATPANPASSGSSATSSAPGSAAGSASGSGAPGSAAATAGGASGIGGVTSPTAGIALPASSGVRAKGPPQPKEYSLQNGMRIILVEEHSLPVVSCLMWYRVGARNERPGSTGISHMVEHLAFDEVGTFRKGELGATIVRNGGQFNGFTSDDFTAFFETLHPAKLDLALKIESMRMRSVRFSKAAAQAEVANLKKEFEEEQNDPASLLASEVRCVSFLHHPYGSPTRGWKPDVEGLTAEDAKGFYDRFYVPNNSTLVVVGDFSTANALASIKKYFAAIPRSATPVPTIRAKEPEQRAERRVYMKYPGKTELLQISYHAPSIAEQDSAAMAVLEKLLNASISGRIKTRLLEPRICSGANSQFELKRDPGLLTLTATPASGQTLQKTLDTIDAMIGQLRSQNISDAELRRAKNQAEYACFSERDGPYRTGFHIGYFDSIGGWKNAYSWPERLRTVSSADILRVARLYLSPENRVVGFLASSTQPKPAPQPSAPPSKQSAPKTPSADTHIEKNNAHTPISFEISKQLLVGYKKDDNATSPEAIRLAAKPASKKSDANSDKKAASSSDKKAASNSDKKTASSSDKKSESNSDKKSASKKSDAKNSDSSKSSDSKSAAGKGSDTAKKSDTSKSADSAKKADSKATDSAKKTDASKAATPSTTTAKTGTAASGSATSSSAAAKSPAAGTTTSTSKPSTTVSTSPRTSVSRPGGSVAPRPPVGSSLQTGHYTRKVLKNGLTVICFESRLCPIVQIAGAIRAGEAYEPSSKPGLAMVLANALNYGTSHATKAQLQAVQEDLGLPPQAMLKFEPGLEQITFQTRCLSKDMVQQLGIVAESLASPALADADMEKAKQDAIAQLRRSDETVAARVNRALMRSLLAPNSPHFPSDPSEKAKVIELLKQSEIKDYYTSTVSPSSTMIVIAGDFDGEQAIKSAEAVFENWQSNAKLAAEPDVVPSTRRSLKVSVPTRDRSQTMVCIGKLVKTAPGDRDFCNLAIADCALTNHPIFSRLVQRDTDEAVLATSLSTEDINSRFQSLGGMTNWSLIVPTEPESVSKEVGTISTELKAFVQKGMTPNEIAEVKRYLSGVICVRYMPNISAAAKSVLDAALERAEGDFVGELLLKIANSDTESINRFIRNVFRPDQSTLVVAGDRQAIKQVQPKLDGDAKGRTGPAEARVGDQPETVSPQ